MSGMLVGMERLSTKSMQLVNGVRDLLFPPACLFCQKIVNSGERQQACCADCFEQIHIWPLSHCYTCGREIPAEMAPGPCGFCLSHPPAQQQTMNLYSYHGPVRDAILDWKLNGREAAVRWLVDAALPRIRTELVPGTLCIPIPMPLTRMRKRGQHHAANLCRWISTGLDYPWQWQLLRRQGEQPRQSSLSGKARRTNLCKAFVLCHDYEQYIGEVSSLCIVDDIMTTGATLDYAARVSRKTGLPVSVLSLARTIRE